MTSGELAVRKAAELREEERRKRSNIDRIILQHARKPYAEIAELAGVTPEFAAERVETLLKSHDHLTERQEERLLIIDMGDLIDETRQRMSGAKDENFADIANVALRGYEAISKRIDARRKLTEDDIADITRAQGEMFLSIVLEAINLVATRLEETHPDLSWDIRAEIEEAFSIALPAAREAVNKRVRE